MIDDLRRQTASAIERQGDADAVLEPLEAQRAVHARQVRVDDAVVERLRRAVAVVLGLEDREHDDPATHEEYHEQNRDQPLDDLARLHLLPSPLLEGRARALSIVAQLLRRHRADEIASHHLTTDARIPTLTDANHEQHHEDSAQQWPRERCHHTEDWPTEVALGDKPQEQQWQRWREREVRAGRRGEATTAIDTERKNIIRGMASSTFFRRPLGIWLLFSLSLSLSVEYGRVYATSWV